LLTIWKISSHRMTCETNTMESGWRLVTKLCLKPRITPTQKVRPCDVQELIHTLKRRKACGTGGIPNEYFRHLSRRLLVHLTHLFNHCFRSSNFPSSWKGAEVIALLKAGKDTKFPQNLRPIGLLSTTRKIFEKVIQKLVQRHLDENDLLNTNQFGFRARHSTKLQCMRLTDHVNLNFI
jgi:hypothetical protein